MTEYKILLSSSKRTFLASGSKPRNSAEKYFYIHGSKLFMPRIENLIFLNSDITIENDNDIKKKS